MIDYKILLREYMRVEYKRHGEFNDYNDFIILPSNMSYPDYKGYNALEEIKNEIIKDAEKLSQKIYDLGTLV